MTCEINTEQGLLALLHKHAIDVDRFGTGSAKTITQLLEEIADGEAQLTEVDGRLMRRLSVLRINVFANVDGKRLRLVEDRQVFKDGRKRRRNLPVSVSEKLKPGENALAAVPRALGEELGIGEFTLLCTPCVEVEIKGSQSYPGIPSEYTYYTVEVLIAPSEYKAEGYEEDQADKTTYFVWKESE